jgi:hypothetical protein
VIIVGEVGERRILTGRGGGEMGRLEILEVGLDLGNGTVPVAGGSVGETDLAGDGITDGAPWAGTVKRVRSLPMEVRPSNECDRAGVSDLVSSAFLLAEDELRNMPVLVGRGGVLVVLGGIAVGGCIQRRIAARASAGLGIRLDSRGHRLDSQYCPPSRPIRLGPNNIDHRVIRNIVFQLLQPFLDIVKALSVRNIV